MYSIIKDRKQVVSELAQVTDYLWNKNPRELFFSPIINRSKESDRVFAFIRIYVNATEKDIYDYFEAHPELKKYDCCNKEDILYLAVCGIFVEISDSQLSLTDDQMYLLMKEYIEEALQSSDIENDYAYNLRLTPRVYNRDSSITIQFNI